VPQSHKEHRNMVVVLAKLQLRRIKAAWAALVKLAAWAAWVAVAKPAAWVIWAA
tara:strand:- start:887 stop:1048 length:162 start_codon:yes stop_codon:yes gene_type:complete